MPALTEKDVRIPGTDVTVRGFLAHPEGASGLPAVLIHPEASGLIDQVRDVARRLAAEGFVALAFDCYSRQPDAPAGAPYEEIVQYYRRITDREELLDLDAALLFLRGLGEVDAERIGVTGFCSGYPIVLSCHDLRLRACVSFYNQLRYSADANADLAVSPLDRIADLWCPFQGHYGAEDGAVPPDDVDALRAGLTRFGKTFELNVYEGAGHGFFNETRPAYHRPSAELAWERTLAFFRKHLA